MLFFPKFIFLNHGKVLKKYGKTFCYEVILPMSSLYIVRKKEKEWIIFWRKVI